MEEKFDPKTLLYKNENAFAREDREELKKSAADYCVGYKKFLDNGKTEREVVRETIPMLEAKGYIAYEIGDKIVRGGKYYLNNRGKGLMLAVMGRESLAEGVQIAAAHIDSPRVDFKPCPVFEEAEMCFFKTHYYGGIKKYQWVATPLSLHGVICTKNGDVNVTYGENDEEPCFYINDLPPHLAQLQYEKSAAKIIEGEQQRTAQGGIPIYNPTIARVKVHYDIFLDSYERQKNLQALTNRSLEELASMRGRADELILDIWNQVETKYQDVTPNEVRLDKCRDYGLIYYYRSSEKVKEENELTC